MFSSADRDGYLRSLGAHLMVNNNSDCIDVYYSNKYYNDLEEAKMDNVVCSSEEILLFTLNRKK